MRLKLKIQRLLKVARYSHRVVPVWRRGYPKTFRRAERLCRLGRFLPEEAFRLGLFSKEVDAGEQGRYLSRKKLTKVQKALNPVSWVAVLKNKGMFYSFCSAFGIAIPRLYAMYFPRCAGWSYLGHDLKRRNEWCRFIRDRLPDEFVIKPTRGAYGRGINVFKRVGNGFVGAQGKCCSAADIYEMIRSDADGYLIQQRLKNHPSIVQLSGTEALQTVRIITFVDEQCRPHVIHAHFKPIVGDHIIDTYLDGLIGNIEAPVRLSDGVLAAANQVTGNGDGIRIVSRHPRTGSLFEGFRLPFWDQACRVVKEAAAGFVPIRTIGWDVALTPEGVCVVEGNVWWDAPNQHGTMPGIVETLQSEKSAAI